MNRCFAALSIALIPLSVLGCPDPPTFCDRNPYAYGCQTSTQTTTTQQQTLPCDNNNPNGVPVFLPVYYIQQECNELCWAAAIKMVGDYFGRYFQECEYASYKFALQSGMQYNCCYGPSACYDAYCNQPAQTYEMVAVLDSGIGLYGDFIQTGAGLPEQVIQAELDNDRPIIIGFQGPFNGHVAVLVGYTPGFPTTYTVYDPWPTFGIVTVTYEQLLQGPNWSTPWVMSFYHLSTTGGTCP